MKAIPVIVLTSGDLDEEGQSRLAEYSLDMIQKGLVSESEILETIENTLKHYYPTENKLSE